MTAWCDMPRKISLRLMASISRVVKPEGIARCRAFDVASTCGARLRFFGCLPTPHGVSAHPHAPLSRELVAADPHPAAASRPATVFLVAIARGRRDGHGFAVRSRRKRSGGSDQGQYDGDAFHVDIFLLWPVFFRCGRPAPHDAACAAFRLTYLSFTGCPKVIPELTSKVEAAPATA